MIKNKNMFRSQIVMGKTADLTVVAVVDSLLSLLKKLPVKSAVSKKIHIKLS